jgi:uncharacterized protein
MLAAWLAFVLLLAPYFGLASARVRERLARPVPSSRNLLVDALIVLALWLPVELDLLPRIPLTLAPGFVVPALKLLALDVALMVFLLLRPLPGVGYTFALRRDEIRRALLAFVAFAAAAIPLALAIGFAAYRGAAFDLARWVLLVLGIFFFIALPEELLFRGLIQNLIERQWGRSWSTLLAAALVFGAAHLNNVSAGYGVPNVPYMLMAALAGLAYGWVWRATGTITAAAITHTLVDGLWVAAFR